LTQPAVSVPSSGTLLSPAVTAPSPAPNPSAAPCAPPIPKEQYIASTSQQRIETHAASAADAVAAAPLATSSASISVSASPDGTPIRPAAPIVKPAVPKSAAKLTDHHDKMDESQYQLRKIDVTTQDLHNLTLDEIRSFDRESLIDLSALLLSRQSARSGSAAVSDQSSFSTDLSKENARLQATVEILKVRDLNAWCLPCMPP
jgi:hypothetical protein